MAGTGALSSVRAFSFLYLLELSRGPKLIFKSMQEALRRAGSRDGNLSKALTPLYAQHIGHITKATLTEHTGPFGTVAGFR